MTEGVAGHWTDASAGVGTSRTGSSAAPASRLLYRRHRALAVSKS